MRFKIFWGLVGLMLFSFCACDSKGGSNEGKKTNDTTGWKPTSNIEQKTSFDSTKIESVNMDSLDYLNSYLGKNPNTSNLWETQPLKSKLEKVLRSEFLVFKDFMKDAVPLKKEQVIYTYSVIPDGTVKGLAYLIIDTKQNKIAVAIILGRVRSDFESKGAPIFTPPELKTQLKKIGF